MANPMKVLTQLSASKEVQFAEVVEAQKTVTISGAEAHLRVTGNGEISGSGAFKAAGAAQLGSSLDVKGAAALSSSLGVVGAVDLQDILDVAGVASFASDVTASAGMDIAGALHVVGAADMDSNLDVAGYAKVVGELSGSAALNIGGASHLAGAAQLDSTLDVDGAVDFDSTLDVAGNVTMQASASIAGDLDVDGLADIAGNLDVHGNATIYGNLEVKGTMTTIESTTVTVADANIQLATVASPTDATADGAGITILGATNKTFQWNDDGHGFTSSEDMNLAAGKAYKIDGQLVAYRDGGDTYFGDGTLVDNVYSRVGVNGAALVAGTTSVSMQEDGQMELTSPSNIQLSAGAGVSISGVNGVIIVSDLSASAGLDVAAAAHFAAAVDMDDTLNVDGVASFQSDISGAAGLELLGAADLGSTLDVAGVASFAADITASAGLDVAGAAHIAGAVDMDAALNVDGAVNLNSTLYVGGDVDFQMLMNVQGAATFQSNISGAQDLDLGGDINAQNIDARGNISAIGFVSSDNSYFTNTSIDSALNLSGSAFVNITTPVVEGKYNVNDAIRALDEKAGQQANDINSNYAALRYLDSDFFDANGMAAFTSSFAAADIEQVSVDVLVQAGGSGPWTNDLLSVQVKAAGAFVGFEISAPAMGASDKVRIIAVKESGSLA